MQPEVEQAVALTKRGDAQSLEKALALLQKTVFSFGMKVCGQREDAEDTVQEVLLQSLPYLPKFDSPKALAVWLYKVAKNRCLMSRRRSKFASKQDLSLEELMPSGRELKTLIAKPTDTPEGWSMRRENAEHLREAVRRLPSQYRLILVLHDMEDLSDSEVAEITGLRPGTVRVRLHRARLFVRKELARRERPPRKGLRSADGTEPAVRPAVRPGWCKALFANLSNYLDGEMDDSLCQELEKHLKGCKPYEAFLASLEQTIARCEQSPGGVPDPSRAAKLRQELLSKYQQLMTTVSSSIKNALPSRVEESKHCR